MFSKPLDVSFCEEHSCKQLKYWYVCILKKWQLRHLTVENKDNEAIQVYINVRHVSGNNRH